MRKPIPALWLGLALLPAAASCDQPSGETTYAGLLDKHAFSHVVSNLSGGQMLDFKVGRGFFRRLWVTAPSSTQAADGLGPLYNARSCMGCHPNNGRGHAPDSPNDSALSMVLRVDVPPDNNVERELLASHRIANVPEPTYGLQLQNFATPGHNAEYRLSVSYREIPVEMADGSIVKLREPSYRLSDLGYGPLHPKARLSPRVAPQVIGLGLLDAIDEKDITERADPDDLDGDGISGRANRVWSREHNKVVLGRFGHKAGMPSINQQAQHAFAIDLGLSVPLYPGAAGDCTAAQQACRQAPDGDSPQYDNLEAHQQVVDLDNLYVNHLAVPARRNADDPDVLAGQAMFERIGCQQCHTAHYRTGDKTSAQANHHQQIAPYTDLLLHDMGEGLADRRPEGMANGREWRTAPLWGIGLSSLVTGHSHYLHDGRARSLLESILWHGGEAQTQRDAVIALDATERTQLLKFIESL